MKRLMTQADARKAARLSVVSRSPAARDRWTALLVECESRLVPCTGEAHSNPHIDNCMQCAPFWGRRLP